LKKIRGHLKTSWAPGIQQPMHATAPVYLFTALTETCFDALRELTKVTNI